MNVNPFEFNSMENYNFLENPLFFRKLNVIQQKDTHVWGIPLFFAQNPDFIWSQRTENQKLYIE